MSKKFSEASDLITNLVTAEQPPLIRMYSRDELQNRIEDFLETIRHEVRVRAIMNSAPETPGSVPPAEKEYPSRPSLQPERPSTPDPALTETVTPSKKAVTPAYTRFSTAVDQLKRNGTSLFELESEPDRPESDDRRDQREVCFTDLDEIKSSLFDL